MWDTLIYAFLIDWYHVHDKIHGYYYTKIGSVYIVPNNIDLLMLIDFKLLEFTMYKK